MRKYFYYVCTMFLATMSLFSCDKDDDSESTPSPTPAPTNLLIGKWVSNDGYGTYCEFVSDNRGIWHKYVDKDEEEYEAFAYKFTSANGKITFLFGDEYDGALFKDNAIIVDGNTFTKVSSGPYSANVIGQWTASTGKKLRFDNFSQGKYRKNDYQYEDFTYTYNASASSITIILNGQKSTATYNGSAITYEGEAFYSLANFPDHDEILGLWTYNNDAGMLHFEINNSGYYDSKSGGYKKFNYVFSPETGEITLYFDSSIETAIYKGEYILYKNNMYCL